MVRGCFTALGSHRCKSAWKVTLQSDVLPFLIMRIEKSWIKCCDFWKVWVSIYVCFVKGMEIPLFPFMLFLPGWVGNPFFSGRPRKSVSHKTGAWSMGSILLILVTLRTNTKRTFHQKGSVWRLLLFEDPKDTSHLKGDTTLGYIGGEVTRFWPLTDPVFLDHTCPQKKPPYAIRKDFQSWLITVIQKFEHILCPSSSFYCSMLSISWTIGANFNMIISTGDDTGAIKE